MYLTTKPPKPKNWRCVGGGDGAHRKDFLNFVSKEDKVKSYVIVSTELSRHRSFFKNQFKF